MENSVYSVTEINRYISNMFDNDFLMQQVSVKGEVSNCKYHSSGHIYFSIKDNNSLLNCIMFAGKRTTGLKPVVFLCAFPGSTIFIKRFGGQECPLVTHANNNDISNV